MGVGDDASGAGHNARPLSLGTPVQADFEDELERRLTRWREEAVVDAAPCDLLPVMPIALAGLAVQVHGWALRIRSGYLPKYLLGAPAGGPGVRG